MIKNTRLHELDSLRALAAIGVVAWHYTNHFGGVTPLPWLMAPFYRHGLLLVDFFFVLSGFVLARAYWTNERHHAFGKNLVERIARIYPLHVVTLCVVALLQWVLVNTLSSTPFVYAVNDKYDFALNLALLNRTGLERGFSFNAPSWSISTEFITNVLFLAVIAAPKKFAAPALLALFSIATAIILNNGLMSHALVGGLIANDIFRTVFGFVIGVGAYSVYDAHLSRRRHGAAIADGLALVSLVAILAYFAGERYSSYQDMWVTLILFPMLILSVAHGRMFKRMLAVRPLIYLGSISYSIYLVHFPVQLGFHIASVALDIRVPYGQAIVFLTYLITTIGVSAVTYHFIEQPGKNLIKTPLAGARAPQE